MSGLFVRLTCAAAGLLCLLQIPFRTLAGERPLPFRKKDVWRLPADMSELPTSHSEPPWPHDDFDIVQGTAGIVMVPRWNLHRFTIWVVLAISIPSLEQAEANIVGEDTWYAYRRGYVAFPEDACREYADVCCTQGTFRHVSLELTSYTYNARDGYCKRVVS